MNEAFLLLAGVIAYAGHPRLAVLVACVAIIRMARARMAELRS